MLRSSCLLALMGVWLCGAVLSSCGSTAPGRLERANRNGVAVGPEANAVAAPTRAQGGERPKFSTQHLVSGPDYLSFPRADDRSVARVSGESLRKSQVFDYMLTTFPEKVRAAIAVMLGNRVLGSETRKHGITVSDSEVADWYQEHRADLERRARLEFGAKTTFAEWLKLNYAQTESQYRAAAMNRERAKQLLSRLVRFLQRREDRVEFRIVSVSDRDLATALHRSLKEGADFEALARQYSLHPTAERGGKMFPVWRGALNPELERVTFELGPGKIGPVISTKGQAGQQRFQIVKVLKHFVGQAVSYAEVEGEILQSLRTQPLSADEWYLWQIRVERLVTLEL
ncbi:MAG: peptidylprolyl isomerase [Planctomycetota bacterium]